MLITTKRRIYFVKVKRILLNILPIIIGCIYIVCCRLLNTNFSGTRALCLEFVIITAVPVYYAILNSDLTGTSGKSFAIATLFVMLMLCIFIFSVHWLPKLIAKGGIQNIDDISIGLAVLAMKYEFVLLGISWLIAGFGKYLKNKR